MAKVRFSGALGIEPAAGSHPAGRRTVAVILTVLTILVLSSSWLFFPYFLQGRTMLANVGEQIQDARNAHGLTVAQSFTRFAEGPGEAEVEVLYATPTYFELAASANATAQYQPDLYNVFIVVETTHAVDLPRELPDAVLVVDGRQYAAIDVEGPLDTDHHRSTTVRFPLTDADGLPIVTDASRSLSIRLTSGWDEKRTQRVAQWDLPIADPGEVGALWSPLMVMALSAGLLSAVLTPCLLQLVVVFLATMTGLSAEQLGRKGAVPPEVGRRMLLVALIFVLGFTALYTASGAVIGYAGKSAQILFADWSRFVSVASGILIIGLGILVGIKSRAPVVCKIPLPGAVMRFDQAGFWRSALLAAGFSLGCMACFSGAIIATLLIYVGALGSAPVGALVMFMFSLGVAIPFVAAALFLSRSLPLIGEIARFTPRIGLASMVVIVGFGIVLITDNFHTVSDLIYPWLGLG